MSTHEDNMTKSALKAFGFSDHSDRSLITDISRTLSQMSGENRTNHRRKKLRQALVREHIKDSPQPTSFFMGLFLKFNFKYPT